MSRLLLIAVLVIIVWLLISRWQVRKNALPPRSDPPPAVPAPANFVVCAHCQVHTPESDALREGAHWYCSEAHRRLGPRP